jgi:hypothetical protein
MLYTLPARCIRTTPLTTTTHQRIIALRHRVTIILNTGFYVDKELRVFERLEQSNHILQALLATLFTWGVTALGAATVFLTKSISRRVLDFMLGFAAGVMIAASFWSLLAPAISMSEAAGGIAWIPAAVGFMVGGLFIRLIDKILPHLHLGYPTSEAEGIKTS